MGIDTRPFVRRAMPVALIVASVIPACGPRIVYVRPVPINPPIRSAAVDRAITGLAEEVLAHRFCPQIVHAYLPLPMAAEARPRLTPLGQIPAAGRLFVEHCSVVRSPGNLRVALGGRAWRWTDDGEDQPLLTRFAVQGYVRFAVDVSFDATLALGVEPTSRRVSIWLTPRSDIGTTVEPIGSVPVLAANGWSSVVGTIATAFSPDLLTSHANDAVRERGRLEFSRALQGGLTLTFDTCTGQIDTALAPLAPGEVPLRPFADGATPWLSNGALALRPDGFDLAGPFSTDGNEFNVTVNTPEGTTVVVQPLCADESEAWRDAWLSSATLPPLDGRARTITGTTTMPVALGCPVVLAIERPSAPLILRYRVDDAHARRADLLACPGR